MTKRVKTPDGWQDKPNRRPLAFASDREAFDTKLAGGVPLSEAAREMEIDPCSVCGKESKDQLGGVLDNIRIENGVVRGTSTCVECLRKQGDHENADAIMGVYYPGSHEESQD